MTELLSLRELARRSGVHVQTVQQWRDRDGLPVYSVGPQRHAVVWGEFLAWLHSHRVQTHTHSHTFTASEV